jgi:hypothetical protein
MTNTFSDEITKMLGELMQISNALGDKRKHTTDHAVAAQLHRLEISMRDCGRLIASALASMPDSLRDRLDAIEVS